MPKPELRPWYLAFLCIFSSDNIGEFSMTYAPIAGACVGFAANRSRATRRMDLTPLLLNVIVHKGLSKLKDQTRGRRTITIFLITNNNNKVNIGDSITPYHLLVA